MCEIPFALARVVFAALGDGGGRCQPARLRRYRTDGNLVAVAFIFGKRNRGEHENLCSLEKTRVTLMMLGVPLSGGGRCQPARSAPLQD